MRGARAGGITASKPVWLCSFDAGTRWEDWSGDRRPNLFTPNLEKALTFLDDSLLPSTSNAVERSNRRHRKMQKTIYRVRTQAHIAQRIALDMQRDAQAAGRAHTTAALHHQRNGGLGCR